MNLTFHGLWEHERPARGDEERFWLHVDSFTSVLDSVVGRPDVRITFDDGNASDVAHALPALRRRGLKATFFVLAGRLGTQGFVDELGVRTLLDAGMSIGSHGMRHRPWPRLDDEGLVEEIVDARTILESIVERSVTEVACPFGAYDRRVLRLLRRYDYRHVHTSDRGLTRPAAWLQPRNTLERGDGAGTVEQILASETRPVRALSRRPRLLVKRWR